MTDDFLAAMAKLPKAKQKKVREFTKKWHADPKSNAINYEKINNVRDSRVRTVRIDQQYRAVVLHPDDGDVYVLVWVDNHDEAMDWARNKEFGVNPATGAFQIINVDEVQKMVDEVSAKQELGNQSLFQCDDETLRSFGVPEVLLPAIKAIGIPQDIQQLNGLLPDEIVEALIWLADGEPVEEVRAAIGTASEATASEPTLVKALSNVQSRRRLVTIKSVDELERMLDAPLDKWRVFLHPSQQQLATGDFAGPTLVTGGAGTGKTVVAMHRAKHLLEEVFVQPDDRLLFTTFTANLAENIRAQLGELCGENAERIHVVHLDSWAVRFLNRKGIKTKIADDDDVQQAWDLAAMESGCPGDAVFLKNEWEFAAANRGVTTREEYLSMSRVGRPMRLDRLQKSAVWNAFEAFRTSLAGKGISRWEDVINQANALVERPLYKAVIVDEAQDFQGPSWRLIRSLVASDKNDIFLVGDHRQRIYGQAVDIRECGIDVADRIRQLKVNYRTTEQIRDWAVDQLTEVDTPPIVRGVSAEISRSLLAGPPPEIHLNDTKAAELNLVGLLLAELFEDIQPEEIAIVARAKWLLDDFKTLLNELGVACVVLDKKSDEEAEGIRLATMHRIKGLEFRCVIVVSANQGIIPDTYRGREDDLVAIDDHRRRERALLYVATTRARDRAIISTSGKPSPLLID